MIVDIFENWDRYFYGRTGDFILDYIRGLNEHSPDTEMLPLDGDNIKARVMSYTTKDISEVVFEAHHRYIDIQFTLAGEDGIGWIPHHRAQVKTDYDNEKDVVLYHVDVKKVNLIRNVHGQFMLLFPGEVHGAGIMVEPPAKYVKKVVIKVDHQLFLPQKLR